MNGTFPKLLGRIIEKYGTRREFAKTVGVSEGTISLKLKGKVGMTYKDVENWCKLLDIDISDIGEYFFAQKL